MIGTIITSAKLIGTMGAGGILGALVFDSSTGAIVVAGCAVCIYQAKWMQKIEDAIKNLPCHTGQCKPQKEPHEQID